MRFWINAHGATLVAALCLAGAAPAQGSQRVIGGGCPNISTSPPRIRGPLAIGTTMIIDGPGCSWVAGLGSSDVRVMAFGPVLPSPSWIRVAVLGMWCSCLTPCDIVVVPMVGLELTGVSLPVSFGIPNDPALRGAIVGVQSFCRIQRSPLTWYVFTPGLEITIG